MTYDTSKPVMIGHYVYVPGEKEILKFDHLRSTDEPVARYYIKDLTVLRERSPGLVVASGRRLVLLNGNLEPVWESNLERAVIDVECSNGTIMAIVGGRLFRRKPVKAVMIDPLTGIRGHEYPVFRK